MRSSIVESGAVSGIDRLVKTSFLPFVAGLCVPLVACEELESGLSALITLSMLWIKLSGKPDAENSAWKSSKDFAFLCLSMMYSASVLSALPRWLSSSDVTFATSSNLSSSNMGSMPLKGS